MALTLRLATEPTAADGSLTTVTIGIDDDGQHRFLRTVRLDISPTAREMAQLRWYLEDFPSHPYDPAPTLAEAARTRMRELGAAMCTALRAATSSPLFDRCVGEGLPETAIEVLGAPGTVAWELLRNPDTGQIRLSTPGGWSGWCGRARPCRALSCPARLGCCWSSAQAGTRDVPFQSVARPLLSALGQAGTFEVETLRPPSYPALLQRLSEARQAGRPVDVVHFDGHGLVHEGSGHLVFEGQGAGQASAWIPGARLGRDLAAAGVRMAVLNACRSADVGAGEQAAPVAFRSLAEELVLAGLGGVLAMQYDVRVDTAARFVTPLYEALGAGYPLGEGAAIARRELFATMTARRARGAAAATDDWFVPVVYEAQRPGPAPGPGPAARQIPDPQPHRPSSRSCGPGGVLRRTTPVPRAPPSTIRPFTGAMTSCSSWTGPWTRRRSSPCAESLAPARPRPPASSAAGMPAPVAYRVRSWSPRSGWPSRRRPTLSAPRSARRLPIRSAVRRAARTADRR